MGKTPEWFKWLMRVCYAVIAALNGLAAVRCTDVVIILYLVGVGIVALSMLELERRWLREKESDLPLR